jgi:hypothetical protein
MRYYIFMPSASKTIRVFEVLYDGAPDGPSGPAGDGTFIRRFGPKDEAAANAFAAKNTCYGRPATVSPRDATRELARRWGVA